MKITTPSYDYQPLPLFTIAKVKTRVTFFHLHDFVFFFSFILKALLKLLEKFSQVK